MAEWVEKNGTYTYTDDEFIAVVRAIEINDDKYYGYVIYRNNESRVIVWSNSNDSNGYHYYFAQEAMERVEAIIKEFEAK